MTRCPDHLHGHHRLFQDSYKTKTISETACFVRQTLLSADYKDTVRRGETQGTEDKHTQFHWPYLLLHIHGGRISNSLLPHN